MRSEHSATARFDGARVATCSLTVGVHGGSGSGVVTSDPSGVDCGTACRASFTSGTAVRLVATADPGSYFAGWQGGGCSGAASCVVTMSSDQAVTATFGKVTRTLTVTPAGAA